MPAQFDLSGRTLLITGASSGLGRSLALSLAAGNNNLVVTARRKELLDELAEEFGAAHVFRPYRDARFSKDKMPLRELLNALRETYCGTIGVEYMYATDQVQKRWWQQKLESIRSKPNFSADKKKRMQEINEKLANLYTKFGQNQLADESGKSLVLDSEEQLAGLPQSLRDAAAAQAEERGLKGKWVIANGRSSMDPFLAFSANRDLREKAWKMFVSRGDNGDANDNNEIITQILQLRAESAQLLGFESYAHWKLAGNMAQHPDAAMDLMMKLWKSAVSRVHEEIGRAHV